jgi:uncharacterized membrane protein YeiH
VIPELVEHAAIAVSAMSGVLAARGKGIDLFGVLVLAIVTALGGGTIRDLVLDVPVVWLVMPAFLATATAVALGGFFLVPVVELPRRALLFADAAALALFTVIGARKGLDHQASAAVAAALGVVTGVAGGILRDMLLGEIPLVFRPAIHLYATAALAGAVAYVLLADVLPDPMFAMLVGAAVTLGLRLAAIRWRINLPVLR